LGHHRYGKGITGLYIFWKTQIDLFKKVVFYQHGPFLASGHIVDLEVLANP